MSLKKYLTIFTLLCLFWGASFLAIHYALQTIPFLLAAFLRILVCLTILGCVMLLFNRRAFVHPHWWRAFLIGWVLIAIPWAFLFCGERYLPPAMASILNATVPFFLVLLTPLFLKQERLKGVQALGLVLGLLGVVLIFWRGLRVPVGPNLGLGVVLVLGMAVFYAVGTLMLRRFAGGLPILTNLFYQSLGASVLLGVLCALFAPAWHVSQMSQESGIAILYMGVFSTTLAWLIFFAIVREKGALYASLSTYFAPVIAVTLDAFVLQTFLQPLQIAGIAVVLVGLVLVQFGPLLLKKSFSQ